MKGVVFTEFLDMVENRYSGSLLDQVIQDSGVHGQGAYTSVGNYPHSEMVALAASLSKLTGTPTAQLLEEYGHHLFGRLYSLYPGSTAGIANCFEFLMQLEPLIHLEVKKLYPEARPPKIDCRKTAPDTLVLDYTSSRHFAPLALGLIKGCADSFRENISVAMEDLSDSTSGKARFTLTKQP